MSASTYREEPTTDGFSLAPRADLLVVVVLSGEYLIESANGGRWRGAQYHPGSIGVTAPGQQSTLRWRSSGQAPMKSVQILLSRALLDRMVDGLGVDAERALPDHLDLDDPFIATAGRALARALTIRAAPLYADSVGQALAAQLLARTAGIPDSGPRRGLGERTLREVLAVLNDRLDEDVKLADLAAAAHMSAFHFLRMFRLSTGVTPHRYLLGLRMQRAVDLLRSTALPVGAIALACGYHSRSHFGAAFQRHSGYSPTVFRSVTARGSSADPAVDTGEAVDAGEQGRAPL